MNRITQAYKKHKTIPENRNSPSTSVHIYDTVYQESTYENTQQNTPSKDRIYEEIELERRNSTSTFSEDSDNFEFTDQENYHYAKDKKLFSYVNLLVILGYISYMIHTTGVYIFLIDTQGHSFAKYNMYKVSGTTVISCVLAYIISIPIVFVYLGYLRIRHSRLFVLNTFSAYGWIIGTLGAVWSVVIGTIISQQISYHTIHSILWLAISTNIAYCAISLIYLLSLTASYTRWSFIGANTGIFIMVTAVYLVIAGAYCLKYFSLKTTI